MSLTVSLILASCLVLIGLGFGVAPRAFAIFGIAFLLYIPSLIAWWFVTYLSDLPRWFPIQDSTFFKLQFFAVPLMVPIIFLWFSRQSWQK